MRALLLKQYMQLELADMREPEIGRDDVLIRVRACGICGSDVHGLDGSSGRRVPPLVMGHEAAGEVARVGGHVRDLRPGARITFDSTIYCGHCSYCKRDLFNLCDNREVVGVSPGTYRRHGAFAEYVAVPRRVVYPLPDNLSFEQATMIEAVSVALHAVNLSGRAQKAVVLGSGMIGLLMIQALRASGCPRVTAVDIDDGKLQLARQLGAAEVFHTSDLKEHDADLAIECVGVNETVQAAIGCVHKGGTVTLVGNVTPKIEFPLQAVVTRQLRIQGSCASSGEFPAAMELMAAGDIRVDPLISAVAPLAEGAAWFDRLYRREPGLMKVILKP